MINLIVKYVMCYNLAQWMNHHAVISESSIFVGISLPELDENTCTNFKETLNCEQ